MQHILEQYGMEPGFSSLEPTHCTMTIRCGDFPVDGTSSLPCVGPFTASSRANSVWVITSSYLPYPSSYLSVGSSSLWPVASTIEPTCSVSFEATASRLMAPTPQAFTQL